MGLFDGKVAIVTGAGRGLGREEALLLAKEGAAVVVNDVGGSRDGEGSDKAPAQEVVDEIEKAGGKAVANYDDISTWKGGEAIVNQAIEELGRRGGANAVADQARVQRLERVLQSREQGHRAHAPRRGGCASSRWATSRSTAPRRTRS